MALSSLSKDVATRLFRMLDVDHHSIDAIKRDHAVYAKLSLITSQADVINQQAAQVVDKAKSRAHQNAHIVQSCTALSPEYDDGTKHLLSLMCVDDKIVDAIKQDHGACAKLSLLSEQVQLLQQQAQQALQESDINKMLVEISSKTSSRLVTGTTYYLYTQNGRHVLSRIASHEWSNYDEFHGKFLYDFDFTFRRLSCETSDASGANGAMSTQPLLLAGVSDARQTLFAQQCGASESTSNAHKISSANFQPICGVLSRW